MQAKVKKVVYFQVKSNGSKTQQEKMHFPVSGQSESSVIAALKK